MYAPTYLPEADRTKLVELNQALLTGLTGEERSKMEKERREILDKTKPMAECSYEELQDLRQQLFDQYQKHASIGSKQTPLIAKFIQQVELREMNILQEEAMKPTEKPQDDAKPKGPRRVSTKQSSYSWTVNIDGDD